MATNLILIPVAPGELIDKITILKIKSERMGDPDKLANVRREPEILSKEQQRHIASSPPIIEMQARLENVNGRIWDLEDIVRDCERNKNFGELFLKTARAIYRTNDERAAIKMEINLYLGSQIVEQKSYADY